MRQSLIACISLQRECSTTISFTIAVFPLRSITSADIRSCAWSTPFRAPSIPGFFVFVQVTKPNHWRPKAAPLLMDRMTAEMSSEEGHVKVPAYA